MHVRRPGAGAVTGPARLGTVPAAAVFGGVAAAVPAGLLACFSGGGVKVPAVVWLFLVGPPAVSRLTDFMAASPVSPRSVWTGCRAEPILSGPVPS